MVSPVAELSIPRFWEAKANAVLAQVSASSVCPCWMSSMTPLLMASMVSGVISEPSSDIMRPFLEMISSDWLERYSWPWSLDILDAFDRSFQRTAHRADGRKTQILDQPQAAVHEQMRDHVNVHGLTSTCSWTWS